ncbi:hypothetical protein AWENTII_001848 [Aspergillus wentii]
MEDTQKARPAIEKHRTTGQGIAGRVDGGEAEIETQTPVGEPGEVAEGLADLVAVAVGAIPAPDKEDSGEDVEGDEGAEDGEDERRKKPGGFVEMERIPGWGGS